MFFVYAVLVHGLFLVLLPVLLLHPKLKGSFLSRLGFYPRGWPGRHRRPVIWFHGASAGDLLALRPVLLLVRQTEPNALLVVTTQTNSGILVAEHIQQVDAYGYAPFDLPWSVTRAVKRIRPEVLVLECAEVWPALLRAVKRFGSRVVVVNGRFSRRLLSRNRWLYRLIGNPLKQVDLFFMQDELHAKRAVSLGARMDRVRIVGNTKLDACRQDDGISQAKLAELARSLGLSVAGCDNRTDYRETPLVWLAGSTHEKEEQMLLEVYARLRKRFSDLRLILAPRYVERAGRVAAMVREVGLSCALRTKGARDELVVILDTVGELRYAYRLANVVVVGGSFVPRGGHNILEPAACGKPVIFGPYMENACASVQVLLGQGGFQVKDVLQLQEVLIDLLADRQKIERLGAAARAALKSARGASDACSKAILELVGVIGN